MKILAVDPGYGRTGIAIIQKDALLFSECFETEKTIPIDDRLEMVGQRLEELIKKYKPNHLAIESVFFSKNKKTALSIAEVRGICKYISKNKGLEIFEYTPNQIKSSVTGNGNANKKEIIKMVPHFVKLDERKRLDDEYDAIAVGITHLAALKTLRYS